MAQIHPTAVVSDQAELHGSVEIGPFCVLEGAVKLGEGVRLMNHVHIAGPCGIGARTIVYGSAAIGNPPQDYKVKPGDPTAGVVIGADCIIREHVTIHSASNDHTPTTLGDGVFMMVGSHAGHDVQIGDRVIIVNGTVLGGHVKVGAGANISGLAAVHQHLRIGRLAMVTGSLGMAVEIPPFCIVGERNRVRGINVIGLRRSGMDRADIDALRKAFRLAFGQMMTRPEQVEALSELASKSGPVAELREFISSATRPICGGPMQPPPSAKWVRAAIRGEVGDDGSEED